MEVAGLALGAAGIAGIFSTCMECFDIFVAGKNFSDDYEQICALFSAQRLRFGLWGESVGFMDDGSSERRAKFETVLGRSDIRITLEGLLNTIRSILTEGSLLDTRYGLAVDPASTDLVQARGMNIFKHSFDHFKERIRRNQKETSVREKARWAFHDAKKFESMTDRLEKCMNSLESITRTSFGLLVEQQQLRLKEEIEQIADIEDVELLHDASSSLSSTHRSLADSESRRFTRDVAASILERHSIVSGSTFRSGETSYRTAPSQLHSDMSILHEKRQRSGSNLGDQSSTRQSSFDMKIPGSWSYKSYHRLTQRPNLRPVAVQAESSRQTCEQCKEEHYKCDARPTSNRESRHCRRCWNLQRECSFQADQEVFVAQEGTSEYLPEPIADGSEIPQNQRMLRGLLKGSDHRKPLIFQSGDGDYGSQLAPFKLEDESYWVNNSGKLISHAQNGSSAVKRMFMELRHIKSGKVPFVSATALDDRLDRVLACIEGPPDTPYEGGIFWIAVTIPESDPNGPPLMRFHTRIYHPNISPRGDICADYQEKWSSVLAFGPQPARDTSGMWYSAKSTEVRWTLGALLTAICGLLASPDVDDPLVPEIAQKYVEDFEGYCEAAKIYTKNFATRPRPDVSDIIFPEIEKSPGRTETPDQWNSAVTQEQDREMIIPAGGSHENYDSPVPSTRAVRLITTFVESHLSKISVLWSASGSEEDYHLKDLYNTNYLLDPASRNRSIYTVSFDSTHQSSVLHFYLEKLFTVEMLISFGFLKHWTDLVATVMQAFVSRDLNGYRFSKMEVAYSMIRLGRCKLKSKPPSFYPRHLEFFHVMIDYCTNYVLHQVTWQQGIKVELEVQGYFILSFPLTDNCWLHSRRQIKSFVTTGKKRGRILELTSLSRLTTKLNSLEYCGGQHANLIKQLVSEVVFLFVRQKTWMALEAFWKDLVVGSADEAHDEDSQGLSLADLYVPASGALI